MYVFFLLHLARAGGAVIPRMQERKRDCKFCGRANIFMSGSANRPGATMCSSENKL